MADDLIAKLRRMAERGTPHEAEVAREKLLLMADRGGLPPRRPPTRAAGPTPDGVPDWFVQGMQSWSSSNRPNTVAWNGAAGYNGTSTSTAAWVTVETGRSTT